MRGREKEKIERKKRAEEAQGTEQKSDRGQAAMRRRGRGGEEKGETKRGGAGSLSGYYYDVLRDAACPKPSVPSPDFSQRGLETEFSGFGPSDLP